MSLSFDIRAGGTKPSLRHFAIRARSFVRAVAHDCRTNLLKPQRIRLRALHEALESDFRTIVRRLPDQRVKAIDVGCGDGFFTKLLAEVQSEVIGVDNSDAYLKEARELSGNVGNVHFVKGDVTKLPFDDGSLNVVWSAHSMHSYPDLKKAIDEFRRVLRPSGLLAVLESDNIHSVMLSWCVRPR